MRSIPKYNGPNPFVGKKPNFPIFEVIKCFLMIPIAIVRIVLVLIALLFLWFLCKLTTICKSNIDEPHSFFRKFFLLFVRLNVRIILFICGFYWIKVNDYRQTKQRSSERVARAIPPRSRSDRRKPFGCCEAAVGKEPSGPGLGRSESNIIVANHYSMYDHFKIFFDTACSGATKIENFNIPVFGSIAKATQSVSIDRSTHHGRQYALQQIENRSERNDLPPLLVFPQGTTTNSLCLTGFKKGAFIGGVPVQPVCIRYKCNQMDLYFGTRSMAYYILWSLCQFVNRVEYDYLEVYHPTGAEIDNPELYASNVQKVMAKHLGIPTSNHTFADKILFMKAQKYKVNIDFTVKDAKDAGFTLDQIIEALSEFSLSKRDNFREYLNELVIV